MIFAVFAFLLAYLIYCRPFFYNGLGDGSYLSRERTCTINAFMIVSIFFMHAVGTVRGQGNGIVAPLEDWDYLFFTLVSRLGQLTVGTFLLFSGYGIMESARSKGRGYLSGFMRNRFWKVFYQFELGTICYYLFAVICGESYTLSETLIGLTGWIKLGGNLPWFIFVTLVMYLVAYIGLHFVGWRCWGVIGGLTVVAYILISSFRPEGQWWWYSSLFCFPAGMLLSKYRSMLESFIARCRISPPIVGALMAGVVYLTGGYMIIHPLVFNFKSIVFAYGLALALSGIRFHRTPRLLLWLGGGAVFCFFYYHVLMFKLVMRYAPFSMSAEVFLFITFMLSLFVAWLVMQVHTFLDKKVFRI